eukprot:131981-Chlamydomonas_euryale.AAC.1
MSARHASADACPSCPSGRASICIGAGSTLGAARAACTVDLTGNASPCKQCSAALPHELVLTRNRLSSHKLPSPSLPHPSPLYDGQWRTSCKAQ